MKRRIAVLDLGTNTFHLLIADVGDHQTISEVATEKRDVKLGEGGITDGIITDAAFERGLQALKYFQSLIRKHQADEVYAVGTAALRNARNGQDFIARVQQETGISVRIIDGLREAELIYKGVKNAIDLSEPALIMDIGGGSVEFIFCDKHEVFYKKSYPVGAARLMALFHHSDPISEANILAIHRFLDEQLEDLKVNAVIFKPKLLVGSAGAFETFADLVIQRSELPERTGQKIFQFEPGQLQAVINDILASTHDKRAANPAIIPVRTDMIVVSAVLTSYIIEHFQIPGIVLSVYSLKEGLLYDKI